MKTIRTLLLLSLSLILFSCSDDDDDSVDPAGTIAINMLDEDNGKTMLGNSDVYIDKAYNFHGRYCLISHFGEKNGLGNIPEPALEGLGFEVAVKPNNAYQIFKDAAIREFPSGKLALNISADYYNVYVISQIKKDETFIGANVKYALMDVPKNGLPQYNSSIGILDHFNEDKREMTLTLPSSDFELEPAFGSSYFYTLDYEKINNKLIVRLIDFNKSDVFGFFIRIKNSYTYVYGTVK